MDGIVNIVLIVDVTQSGSGSGGTGVGVDVGAGVGHPSVLVTVAVRVGEPFLLWTHFLFFDRFLDVPGFVVSFLGRISCRALLISGLFLSTGLGAVGFVPFWSLWTY